MKKRLSKKAYFFLIDSILALSVLAVGAFLILVSYISIPSKGQPEILSEDIMDFFSNNKIKDINNLYAGLGGTLWELEGAPGGICDGEVLTVNGEITLLQQVAEFYEKSSGNSCYLDLAEKFIDELTKNTIPQQYTFEFLVDDTLIYPLIPSLDHIGSKSATRVLIPSKKIVFGISNQEFGDLYGPFTAEVMVWQ